MTATPRAAASRAFYDESFHALLAASPEVATELGVSEIAGRPLPADRFSDLSEVGEAGRRALMADTLRRLQAIGSARGTDGHTGAGDGDLDFRIYDQFLRQGILGRLCGTEGADFTLCDSVADHLGGAQTEVISCLADWQPIGDAHDAEAWMARLAAVPRHMEELIGALHRRAAAGNVMPAPVVGCVLAEIDALLATPLELNPLYLKFRGARPGDSPQRVASELRRSFFPAYRRLRQALGDGYPTETRLGLWRLPEGEAYYAFLLKAYTTTGLSADDIHELGRDELARQQAELRSMLTAAGFAGGTLSAQFAAFDRDPRVRYDAEPDSAQLLEEIRQLVRETQTSVMPLFGIQPRAPLLVRAVPKIQETGRHSAYVPPAPDGSRPGAFEVNMAQTLRLSRPDLCTLVYHEAVPGHHLQLSIAQELVGEIPAFRRFLVHAGFIEGWAKYAELLPGLEGINRDSLWRIARGRSELYSTANLVLDTSIHARRWTREQSIRFFAENTGCASGMAEAIVDRVAARPAQVCAYKIGMRTVVGARQRMERALGSRFDIRRFHDIVLGAGSLPLGLVASRVDAAIADARGAGGP